jgi:hypothetical protein
VELINNKRKKEIENQLKRTRDENKTKSYYDGLNTLSMPVTKLTLKSVNIFFGNALVRNNIDYQQQ